MPNKTSKFEELVERYRFWIGGILILAIVGGSAVLIWRENYAKPKINDRIAALENKIDQLEAERDKIQETSIQTNSNPASAEQNSNIQTEAGQVAGTTSPPASSASKSTAAPQVTGIINLNAATLAELDSLSGIGPVYAQRIIDYRDAHGGFKSIDEVKNVKGIGDKTFEKFKNQITI